MRDPFYRMMAAYMGGYFLALSVVTAVTQQIPPFPTFVPLLICVGVLLAGVIHRMR